MGKKDTGMYNNLIYVSQIGIMMLTPILGGVFVGKYLSDKMGGNMLPFILCLLIGIASSFYELYRFSISYIEKNKRKRK